MKTVSLLLLFALQINFGCTQQPWLLVRVNSTWAAVRQVSAGSEYWLRPECVLETVQPEVCASEWTISVRFWSSEWVAQVENAIQRTTRCQPRRSCRVYPFQTTAVSFNDQDAQWSSDKVRFVNGPLPPKMKFRLKRQNDVQSGNCSFEASNFVIKMSVEQNRAGRDTIIKGYEVQTAYQRLDPLEAQLGVAITAPRLAQILLRQRAPNKPIRATDELARALKNWATWQNLVGEETKYHKSRIRRVTPNSRVFLRFPKAAQLTIAGDTEPSSTHYFSVVTSPTRSSPKQSAPRQARAVSEEPNELTNMQQRLAELETLVAQLASNSSNVTMLPMQQPIPTLQHNNKSNYISNRNNTNLHPNIRSIDDCMETTVLYSRILGNRLFYLRPLERLVHCTRSGELVVLRRQKGDVNFNRNWSDYRKGFGNANTGDYWLGLDFLANYTAQGDVCARVQMKPWRLSIKDPVVQYSDFEVAPENKAFRLHYSNSRSTNATKDALLEGRGQPFSTYDRDQDAFIGNCAQTFAAGNWYKSCTQANIFGQMNSMTTRSTMCWRGVHPTQGDMCSPLTAVTLSVRRASQGAQGKKVIFSYIENTDAITCTCKIKTFRINGTGIYYITAGGAPGGMSKKGSYERESNREPLQVGGRGAEVRIRLQLQAGTRLGIAVGCPGGSGVPCGHGGDATWITGLGSSRKLLLVAGGGGGGGRISHGTHGRAVMSGSKPNTVFSSNRVTLQNILGKALPDTTRGRGWHQLKQVLFLQKQSKTSSGVKSSTCIRNCYNRRYYNNRNVKGGGGGGGYEGGVSGRNEYEGGGGGGSFCDKSLAVSCEIRKGGNFHNTGYVIIEKQTCF